MPHFHVTYNPQGLSDNLCSDVVRHVMNAAIKRRMFDEEAALRRVCETVWFPLGYRVGELMMVEYQGAMRISPHGGLRVEIRPTCPVPPLTLFMRRIWRRFRPYKYERFLGRKV